MAEAHDLVQLAFADVEKCNGIAHRVAGQAFGVQARIAERQPARRGEAKLCCRTRGRTLPAAERPGGSSNVQLRGHRGERILATNWKMAHSAAATG